MWRSCAGGMNSTVRTASRAHAFCRSGTPPPHQTQATHRLPSPTQRPALRLSTALMGSSAAQSSQLHPKAAGHQWPCRPVTFHVDCIHVSSCQHLPPMLLDAPDEGAHNGGRAAHGVVDGGLAAVTLLQSWHNCSQQGTRWRPTVSCWCAPAGCGT